MSQRTRLQTAESQVAELKTQAAEMKAELKHLQFIRGNKLYRHALEDLGFAAEQSVIRLRVVRAQVDSELGVIEKLLATAKE